jgi:hypothetical protein
MWMRLVPFNGLIFILLSAFPLGRAYKLWLVKPLVAGEGRTPL